MKFDEIWGHIKSAMAMCDLMEHGTRDGAELEEIEKTRCCLEGAQADMREAAALAGRWLDPFHAHGVHCIECIDNAYQLALAASKEAPGDSKRLLDRIVQALDNAGETADGMISWRERKKGNV